jgi:polyisoprenoid-binding protein YceI
VGFVGITSIFSAFTIYKAIAWNIAKGWEVKFEGKDAKGKFEKLSGTINFDASDLENSTMKVSVEVTSIATGNFLKNSHAKGEKWFDSKKYSSITFTSSSFSKLQNGFSVIGELEMHGVKKVISIPFQFNNNNFTGSFSVKRMDYNIGSMEGMSKKVGNEIKIEITVPVVKK